MILFFTTQKSNSITDRNVRLIVKKALDLAGLSQYSARDFRHSFAAISLRLGADESDVKTSLDGVINTMQLDISMY